MPLAAPAPSRRRRVARLAALDPVADHQAIVRIDGTLEFPWDTRRALELALFRTFAVPRISGLLHRTGEFERRPQRRYDDTVLLIAEFVEHGYDTPRGRAAIAGMNAQHGRYRIRNRELLYVLSTFVLEPARWIDAHGWRSLTAAERTAGFVFWREVGERMGIGDEDGALSSAEALDAWSRAYEATEMRWARSNALVGRATRDLLLGTCPHGCAPSARGRCTRCWNRRSSTPSASPTPRTPSAGSCGPRCGPARGRSGTCRPGASRSWRRSGRTAPIRTATGSRTSDRRAAAADAQRSAVSGLRSVTDGDADALVRPALRLGLRHLDPADLAVLATWVPPSACLSSPTMSMTRSG
jgi:hypothetical protein